MFLVRDGNESVSNTDRTQDAIANCLCCPCWNCDYTLRTTHSRENSLHKLRIDNELKLDNFLLKLSVNSLSHANLLFSRENRSEKH